MKLELVTVVALPAEHKPVDGDVSALTPFAVPHTPSIDMFALQDALLPPLIPLQVHVNGPEPDTAVGDPTEQRLVDGGAYKLPLFDDPHTASRRSDAEHDALVPPFDPAQVHV